MAEAKITVTHVPERYRLAFSPRHLGKLMGVVETAVYDHMGNLAAKYNWANFGFYELSNGGWLSLPVARRVTASRHPTASRRQ